MKCIFKCSSAFIFGVFLILGVGIFITNTNQNLFLLINSMHNIIPVHIWEFMNFVSYRKYLILQILLLLITYIWKKDKFLNVILVIVAYFVVFAGLKIIFGEARPYVILDTNSFYWLNMYEDAIKSANQSFPSGHVGNMAVFAFTLNILFFKKSKFLQMLMLLLVVFTGITRICTGWHWPIDVIASGLIGYILVKVCFAFTLSLNKVRK